MTCDSPKRVKQMFASNGLFRIEGNEEFADGGKRYLVPPKAAGLVQPREYTFGSMFLQKQRFW